MRAAGLDRILVTPGNHEFWSHLDELFGSRPGESIQLSETVTVMPRGFRFSLGGRSFMSLGGAASTDFASRVPFTSWWPCEIPTEDDVNAAIASGPVDVLLTHETVDGSTVEVEEMLRTNPQRWNHDALAYAKISRGRVIRVWNAVNPRILAHGHMHLRWEIELADERRVYSLGCDSQAGNVGLLDLKTLDWSWLGGDGSWTR
jgi:hypothetical protein